MRLKLCHKFNTDHFRLAKFWVGPNCLKHFFIENWIIVTVLTLNYLTVLSFTSSFIAMRLKQRKIFLPKFFLSCWNETGKTETNHFVVFLKMQKKSFLSRRRKKSTSFPPLKKISIEKKFALKKVFFLHSFSPKKSSWVGCCCCCRGCCCFVWILLTSKK